MTVHCTVFPKFHARKVQNISNDKLIQVVEEVPGSLFYKTTNYNLWLYGSYLYLELSGTSRNFYDPHPHRCMKSKMIIEKK